jgi:hypothetical protein
VIWQSVALLCLMRLELAPPLPLQVSTLQQRVVALQQSHEVQDKELARLRAETLALAARTAAASTGSPGMGSAQRSGSSAGSSGGGGEHARQLQVQMEQLQEANHWLTQQLGECCLQQVRCRSNMQTR